MRLGVGDDDGENNNRAGEAEKPEADTALEGEPAWVRAGEGETGWERRGHLRLV